MLLLLHYLRFGSRLPALLTEPLGGARWVPPLWFLGVYEELLHGSAALPFAGEMARFAVRGTAVAAGVAVLTYPGGLGADAAAGDRGRAAAAAAARARRASVVEEPPEEYEGEFQLLGLSFR